MTFRIDPSYVPEDRVPATPWADSDAAGPAITGVTCTVTAPEGVNLVVVKITTSDDGLYGVGCATFTQRALAVRTVVEEYIAPFLIGRDPADITDIHHALRLDSYWRSGPVLNNAISGVDMALWDIKGKLAGLPVWQMLGGRTREYVTPYVHATGADVAELTDQVDRHLAAGYSVIRCQVQVAGSLTYGARTLEDKPLTWNAHDYVRQVPEVLAQVADRLSGRASIIHDVHERLTPSEAVQFVDRLGRTDLFYIEDLLAPEDLGWLPQLRERTGVPLAIGELFTDVNEYLPLIQHRAIDYIRCHLSAIGGLTPAWRLASAAELFGVRTAWHGPRDVSPIGHAAGLALGLASPAFGVHEHHEFSEEVQEMFPGAITASGGKLYPTQAPGLGVDFDENVAAAHPPTSPLSNWHYGRVRRTDGAIQRP